MIWVSFRKYFLLKCTKYVVFFQGPKLIFNCLKLITDLELCWKMPSLVIDQKEYFE